MIYTTLLNIAIFQGIILGLIILRSPIFKSTSNKYLAFLIFSLSIKLLTQVFESQKAFSSYPILRFIDNIEWVFLIPAFLYLFIENKTDDIRKSKLKNFWYFIPFAYSAVINIVNDLDHVAGIYTLSETGNIILGILGLIHLALALTFIPFLPVYCYFRIRDLKDSKEKKWTLTLLTLISSVLFIWLITALAGLLLNYDISSTMSAVALFATFIIHWTTYKGIYKYKLAKNRDAVYTFLNTDSAMPYPNLQIVQNSIPLNYKESITAENLYFQKLEFLCKEQHIYTDCTLNREKIAEKLGISAGYVSQIVNTITGHNFAHYINQFRVEAVKNMMSDPEYDNYNLLTMGLESGFTSKTTFYNAFKKVTGQTPNEYKIANK